MKQVITGYKKKIMIITFSIIILSQIVSAKVTYNYMICGKSMYPLMNKDVDCAYYKVQTVSKEDVTIGDIICFNYYKPHYLHSSYQYVCHEVISYDDRHFCTQGLNNNIPDKCMEWKYAALEVLI